MVTSVANCRHELNILFILTFVELKILKTTGIKVKTCSDFCRTMQDLSYNRYARFRLIMNMYLRDIWLKKKKENESGGTAEGTNILHTRILHRNVSRKKMITTQKYMK